MLRNHSTARAAGQTGMLRQTTALLCFSVCLVAAQSVAVAQTDETSPENGERYAFLVGVRQYDPNELRSLPYSESDVDQLAELLTKAGYREENVVLMTQTRGAEQTRFLPLASQIRKELALLLADRTESDTVLLAFAGHGVQFVDDEDSYFCPADARLTDTSTLVSLTEVYEQLEKCPARLKVMFVDACRNDPQSDNSRSRAVVDLQSVSRPPKQTPAGGTAVFYSCSAGQRAFENEDLKHGVFFYYVIKGLEGAASSESPRSVTLDDLQPYVKKRVNDFVRAKYGWRQIPELTGTSRGLVPLVSWPENASVNLVAAGPSDLTSPQPAEQFQPGGKFHADEFGAKRHTIRRLISFRKITNNRLIDDKKFEPSVVRISGDGSKLVFWAPGSGMYTVNPDGTELQSILTELPERRQPSPEWLLLSPDGQTVYYQVFGSGIFRIGIDGSDQRPLILRGSEYEPLRLRQSGHRIFFSRRDGIYSIDTFGNGDYRTILTPKRLEALLDQRGLLLGAFDVNELGTRVVCIIRDPKLGRNQLFAINADGTDFRHLIETEFEPSYPMMSPDGGDIVFGGPGGAYAVEWDGTNYRKLPLPDWGLNQASANRLSQFSRNGHWFCYFSTCGPQITQLDGSGRFEPYNTGPWPGFDDAFFNDWHLASFSDDLGRFAFISQFWRNARPRQLIVGEFNSADVTGLPVISEVEFPSRLSTNPDLPNHIGKITMRVSEGVHPVKRVQFCLLPVAQRWPDNPQREWNFEAGIRGLDGNLIANDEGRDGDEKAGDGIYTGRLIPHPNIKPEPGMHPVRVIAHTENDAVIVDVEGVLIK